MARTRSTPSSTIASKSSLSNDGTLRSGVSSSKSSSSSRSSVTLRLCGDEAKP
jgi:hypothetical protein